MSLGRSVSPQKILSLDWDVFFDGSESLHNPCDACSWFEAKCPGADRSTSAGCRPTVGALGNPGYVVEPEKWLRKNEHHPLWVDKLRSKLYGANIVVAECHGDIYELIKPHALIVNVDAHDDYTVDALDDVNCANWGYWAATKQDCRCAWVARPSYEEMVDYLGDYALTSPDPLRWQTVDYTDLFFCLSRPWTPKWYDRRFYLLLAALQAATKRVPTFIGPSAKSMQKRYRKEQKCAPT